MTEDEVADLPDTTWAKPLLLRAVDDLRAVLVHHQLALAEHGEGPRVASYLALSALLFLTGELAREIADAEPGPDGQQRVQAMMQHTLALYMAPAPAPPH